MRSVIIALSISVLPVSAWAKGKPAPAKSAPAKPAAKKAPPMPTPTLVPVTTTAPPPRPATARPGNAREVVKQESKIEFDERVVQGQRAAGAIYLFQRGESEFRSMVQVPTSFMDRTIKIVLPEAPR